MQVFGIGALSAKKAADQKIAALTELRGHGLAALAPDGTAQYDEPASIGETGSRTRISDHIRLWGVPEHVDRNIRESAKYVSSLDPDIACKHSWSMSVKILTQRQRNYDRRLQEMIEGGAWQRAQKLFERSFGFKF